MIHNLFNNYLFRCILSSVLIALLVSAFPLKLKAQNYQQLLVSEDGKNALIYIKRLPTDNSILPFEISVQWVDKDLNPVTDTVSYIIFSLDDMKIYPSEFLKISTYKQYIYFNKKTKLNFSYQKNIYKGGEIILNLNLYYLKNKTTANLKSSWEKFFFKNPELLKYKTSVTANDLVRKPKLIVQYRGFKTDDGSGTLTMGEEGELVLKIKNEGNAKSEQLLGSVKEKNGVNGISFYETFEVQSLEAGKSTLLKIPVRADYTLKNGTAIFEINFSKTNKYAPKSIVCNLKTKAIVDNEKPVISLSSTSEGKDFKLTENPDSIIVSGTVSDNVAVSKLFIDNKEVSFDAGGFFTYCLNTENTKQDIKIIARDYNGNEAVKIVRFNLLSINETNNQGPEIIISYPDISRGFKFIEQNNKITIKGKVQTPYGVYRMLINGKEIYVDNLGYFSHTVMLDLGDNHFLFTAVDKNLNTSTKKIIIQRSLDQTGAIVANNPGLLSGKYFALLIGVEDYMYLNTLDEPIDDAEKLKEVLTRDYSFEEKNIFFLKNPTRAEILDMLDVLVDKVSEKDNLLIFYAGHGYWDKSLGKEGEGFWLPADAKLNKRSNWIPNSSLTNYLGGIKSKNTLLISDACFSGGIFRSVTNRFNEKSIKRLYELPSRKAMTSGTLNVVPDHSVFIEYFIKRLNENTNKYLPARSLFFLLEEAVRNNSDNIPQYGTIQKTGDEGGDFIFIRSN